MACPAVVWRNPNPVKHRWRCRPLKSKSNVNVYVVEELVSARNDFWVSAAAFEVVSHPSSKRPQESKERNWTFGLGG